MRWLVVLLCACADEAAIAPNTCGNWVLEPGEDCDQPTGCTADCRLACDADAPCPTGSACGLDHACHAPTGRFATEAIASPLGFSEYRVGDLDGDGRADVVGIAGTNVRAAYAANGFALPVDTPLPTPNGPVAIGDVDGDGRNDVVVPTLQGLVTFSPVHGVPTQLQVPAVAQAKDVALGVGLSVGTLTELTNATGMLRLVDVNGPRKPCDLDLNPTQIPLPTLAPWFDRDHAMNAFVFTGMTGPPVICADGVAADGGAIASPVLQTLAGTTAPTYGVAVFAKSTRECPDLYAPVLAGQPGMVLFSGTGTTGFCSVDRLPQAVFDGAPLGTVDGTQVITTSGLFVADGGFTGGYLTLLAERAWQRAASGDFDGVAPRDFAVTSDQPGIEVFLSQTPSVYERRIIATAGVPTALISGDFDHDGRTDLAIALPDPLDPTKSLVEVSFDLATMSAPLRLPKVTALALLIDGVQNPGFGSEFHIAAATADGGRTTIFARDRVLTAPYVYQTSDFTGVPSPTSATNVVIGGFGTANGAGALGVFAPRPDQNVGFFAVEYARLSPTAPGYTATETAEAGGCVAGGFCPPAAHWVAMPVEQGTLALAFSNPDDVQPDECGQFYLARGASGPFPQGLGCVMLDGPAARNRVERARDLGDGLLATAGDGEVWTARVAFAGDQQPVFDNWVSMGKTVGGTCSDVARLELGTRDDYGAGLDLATACTVGNTTSVFAIFAASPSNPDPTPQVEKLFDVPTGGPLRLEAGDIDGDGLTDLVYSDGQTLRVRLQCDPHGGCP